MAKTPGVLVVDQDLNTRAETEKALRAAGFVVAGACGYGREALAAAQEAQADAVLVRVEESTPRALQTAESLVSASPETPVIVYSTAPDAASVRRAMLCGARDYLLTPVRPDDLARSIYTVLEQEERRRMRQVGQLAGAPTYGTVITVFGAKGGVGKTTLSTNLAAALARQTGQAVVIADLDTSFGDVPVFLEVSPERTLVDLCRNLDVVGRQNIDDYLVAHGSGVMVLVGPPTPSDWVSITPSQVRRVVQLLAETHDYVVLDLPGAFNEVVAAALEAASLVLVVTNLDVASIKDTLVALELLRAWSYPEERLKLAVNHSSATNGVGPGDLGQALAREIFWQIPYDRSAVIAHQIGQPVVISRPSSRMAQSIIELANVLSGSKRAKQGFVARLLGRSAA